MKKIVTIALTFICCLFSIDGNGNVIKSNFGARGCEYIKQKDIPPLPEGLIAVRYLESMGNQYINTGFHFQKNIRVIVSVEYTAYTKYGWGRNAGNYEVLWDGSKFYFGGGYSIIEYVEYNRKYEYDLDFTEKNMVARINGDIVRQTSGTQPTDSYILLFALYRSGLANPVINFSGRHYYFMIFSGDELLMNLVPCRFINELGENEGAMYDLVSKQLFRNNGSGEFIIGPDK